MNVSGDAQGGGDSFKTLQCQSSTLSFYSTGNLNYYFIFRYLDNLPTANCAQEIWEALYHIK